MISRQFTRILLGALTVFATGLIFHYMRQSQDSLVYGVSAASKKIIGTSSALFYHHDPDAFLQQFEECFFDLDQCRVLYWHVQKTGGSYIASRFYPVLNNGSFYNSREWCCNEKFMKQSFWPNTEEFCSKRLGVYEVRSHDYQQVVEACQSIEKNVPADQRSRYIGFVSIREPIARTLSAIHQRCNVHSAKLDAYMREACEQCSYEDHRYKPFFEKFVNETNDIYSGLKHYLMGNNAIDFPVYIIDNEQIDDFFTKLEYKVNEEFQDYFKRHKELNRVFKFPPGKSNAETSEKLCDFGMPSELIKQHRIALDAYHWIWSRGYIRNDGN